MKKSLKVKSAILSIGIGLAFAFSVSTAQASLAIDDSGNHKKSCWFSDGCKFKVDKSCAGHLCG
ncbi:MAG: hypothetical protein ACI9C9_002794 [Marivirga sp.]|jgi:hypothetical protein